MRIKSLLLSLIGLGAGAAGAYFAGEQLAEFVEDRSELAARERLDIEGFDWTEVEAHGLQVVISGTAPDEAARFEAARAVGRVVDAARIIDETDVETKGVDLTPAFSIELLRTETGISMIGLVPANTDRAGIARQLSASLNEGKVSDFLETADYEPPSTWEASVRYGLEAITELNRAKVSISADAVAINATANTPSEKAKIESQYVRGAPSGVQVTLDIKAPRPFLSPYTLRVVHSAEDGARFDACAASDEESQARILAAARALGMTGQIDCPLALGAPNTNWGSTAAEAIAALGALPSGTVTLTDTALSLTGTLGTDQALFDSTVADLQASIDPLYTVRGVLPQPPLAEGEAEPLSFSATRSPEGDVKITGDVPSAPVRQAATSFADAAFGVGKHRMDLSVTPQAPLDWSQRVFAGLEGLATLQFGALEITETSFDLRGSSGDPEIKEKVTGLISEALDGATPYKLNVTYSEALDPLASLLKGPVCVADIASILKAQKITFEPGSTTIDGSGNDTLDAIAGVVKSCRPDIVLEIGGHTDSQGSEQLNQRISQERAFAVRTALIDRRVSPGVLKVVGYGESDPIADNATEEGREANRRIEFTLPVVETVKEDTAQADPASEDEAGADPSATSDVASETAPESPSDASENSAESASDASVEPTKNASREGTQETPQDSAEDSPQEETQ
ncbi:MAG: OmpA family protein [Pseudomonadota bacterium]